MSSKRVALLLAALFCMFAVTPTALLAQSTSAGSVGGLVTDASGGAVAGATITLTDKATGTPRTTISNQSGRYNFADVPPGPYGITTNKPGFRVAKVTEIQVTVGTPLTVDFALEIGSVAETVEVTTSGAELQTTNATMGTTLSGETLLLLPNLGRDVTTLLIAQPGVSPDGYSAGANYDQNMYQLDGGNNSNDMDGSMSIYTPSSGSINPQNTGGAPSGVVPTPVESVEEFKVSTSNQTADFNGAGGAQIQLVTKPVRMRGTVRPMNIIWAAISVRTRGTTMPTPAVSFQRSRRIRIALAPRAAAKSCQRCWEERRTFSLITKVFAILWPPLLNEPSHPPCFARGSFKYRTETRFGNSGTLTLRTGLQHCAAPPRWPATRAICDLTRPFRKSGLSCPCRTTPTSVINTTPRGSLGPFQRR